jgi:HPt (histidine-containing phosphotransfer) domain-containing protein
VSVFDPQALTKLAHDMKDKAFARAFAVKYQRLLEHRVQRITTALSAPDFIDAMDATLSLKVSSTTVGTCELAEIAQQIELDVRRQDAPAARIRASTLPDAARRAHAALEQYLVTA